MRIKQSLIHEIVRRILSVTQPTRILLFGSAATDTMTPDSDIDLLILEDSPEDTRTERALLRSVLRGLGYGVDVVVMQTERFEESKFVIGGIAYPAHKHGRVIYEAA